MEITVDIAFSSFGIATIITFIMWHSSSLYNSILCDSYVVVVFFSLLLFLLFLFSVLGLVYRCVFIITSFFFSTLFILSVLLRHSLAVVYYLLSLSVITIFVLLLYGYRNIGANKSNRRKTRTKEENIYGHKEPRN